MLGLILNESEMVKKTLDGDLELPLRPYKIIRLIIKKFIIENKTEDEITSKINKFLSDKLKENYNKSYWNKCIESTIKSLEKKDNKMIDINEINIYKEEIEIIESLNDFKLEKLAFTLLVYAKINYIVNPNSDGKINIPLAYIIKESSIKKDEESKILLNRLYKMKFILMSNSCDSTSIKVNYIKNEGDVKINIDVLNDYQPITYYLEHKENGKWKKCKRCENRFEVNSKSKKPTLLCKKCSKDVDNINRKNRKRS